MPFLILSKVISVQRLFFVTVWSYFPSLEETWSRRNTHSDISHWNTALWLLFYIPNKVYLYDIYMSIVKHFFVVSVKYELDNIKKGEWQWLFMAINIWNFSNMNETWEIRVNFPLYIFIWNVCKKLTLHLQPWSNH